MLPLGMFQADSPMPWRTVLGNVTAGLEVHGTLPEESRAPTDDRLQWVGLASFGDLYPHQHSGGMRKRTTRAPVLALDL